jgi:hypothetical protein
MQIRKNGGSSYKLADKSREAKTQNWKATHNGSIRQYQEILQHTSYKRRQKSWLDDERQFI